MIISVNWPENLNSELRPVDLARAFGLSTQAIRNYEDEGILPPAERTASGHRRYGELHLRALAVFVTMTRASSRPQAARVLRACNDASIDDALTELDAIHAQLFADRRTVNTLAAAIGEAASDVSEPEFRAYSPVQLARRLGLTTTTLRDWESAGILTPARDPQSGHRTYAPQDVRDAHLAQLLRRGGHRRAEIATTLSAVRDHGGIAELAEAVSRWQTQLTERSRALLSAGAALARYLEAIEGDSGERCSSKRGRSINVPGVSTASGRAPWAVGVRAGLR